MAASYGGSGNQENEGSNKEENRNIVLPFILNNNLNNCSKLLVHQIASPISKSDKFNIINNNFNNNNNIINRFASPLNKKTTADYLVIKNVINN